MIASYYKIERTPQPSYFPHGMSLQLGRNQKKRRPTLALCSQRVRKYQMAWIQVNNCNYTLKYLNLNITKQLVQIMCNFSEHVENIKSCGVWVQR